MNEFAYVILRTSGSIELIKTAGSLVDFHDLKARIGCDMIDICRCNDALANLMVVDDVGALDPPKPVNRLATILYSNMGVPVHGDVAVGCDWCEDNTLEPDFYALPMAAAYLFYSRMEQTQNRLQRV